MINFTLLDYYYRRNLKIHNDTIEHSKYNHINIGMSFNNDYTLLSTISIASILKNSNINSYIFSYCSNRRLYIRQYEKNTFFER